MLLCTGPEVGASGKRVSALLPKSTRKVSSCAFWVVPYSTHCFFDTLTDAEPPRFSILAASDATRWATRFCSARRRASRASGRSSALWVACLAVSGWAAGCAVADDPGTTAATSAKAAAPPKTPVTRLFTEVLHEGGSGPVAGDERG